MISSERGKDKPLRRRTSIFFLLSLIGIVLLQHCNSFELTASSRSIVDIKGGEASLERTINQPNTEFWFVIFYEPWCRHSKNLLQTLDDIATASLPTYHRQRVSFSKIDCSIDENKSLCKKHDIPGYPYLRWYRDGTFHDYKGGTIEHDEIMSFLMTMNEPVLSRTVDKHQDILENSDEGYGKLNGATFVLYMPSPDGNSSTNDTTRQHQMESIRKVARHYQDSNSFVFLEPSEENEEWVRSFADYVNYNDNNSRKNGLSPPLLIRVEKDLKPIMYPTPHDWTFSSLSQFIDKRKEVVVPFVHENNIHDLGRRGKYLAMAIVDPDAENTHNFLSDIRQFASSCPLSIRKQYQFVWINAKEWTSFLKKFSIPLQNSPQLFVLDYPNDIFWTNPYQSNSIADLQRFLVDIDAGKILSINLTLQKYGKRSIYGTYFGLDWNEYMLMRMQSNRPWLFELELILCIFGIILFIPPSCGRVHDYIEKYIWQGVIDRVLSYFGLMDNEEKTTEETTEKTTDEAKKND